MEHTKEPWRYQRGKDGHEVWAPFDETSSMRVAACGWAESFDQANARRIVACVNACRGIPTDLLEKDLSSQIIDMRETMQQRDELQTELSRMREFGSPAAVLDLRRQRDELLAQMCRTRNLLNAGEHQAAMNCLCDAIAKVKP